MSLVRIAARFAAVQALKGKTLVGNNVLDSQIGAIDIAADGAVRTDREEPFISVYCDGGTNANTDAALRATRMNGATTFLFEAAYTAAYTAVDEETGAAETLEGIPATDASFEFYLDLVMRQIGDALTDPRNEWAEVFRRLCVRFGTVERARTSGDGSGARLAAHQLKLVADLLPDPVQGLPADGTPMAEFFRLAEALNNPATTAKVALMKATLAGELTDWETTLKRYGIARDEGDAMLITVPEGAENDVVVANLDAQPAVPTP
jgi:hypothetical protein